MQLAAILLTYEYDNHGGNNVLIAEFYDDIKGELI